MRSDRRLVLVSIVALSLAGAALGAESSGEQRAQAAGRALIGTRAPRLVLKTIDGETIDLGRLYGRQAVYLKFWATWCVPCRQQMPHFEHTYETAGPDLAVIAINAGFNDSVEEVRAYRRELGITMPIAIDDGQAAGAFHLRVTPQHIVIGRDGRILYVGHLADAQLDAALAAARSAPAADGANDGAPARTAAAARRYRIGDLLPELSPATLDGRRFAFYAPAARPSPADREHLAGRLVLVFLSPWCESYSRHDAPRRVGELPSDA